MPQIYGDGGWIIHTIRFTHGLQWLHKRFMKLNYTYICNMMYKLISKSISVMVITLIASACQKPIDPLFRWSAIEPQADSTVIRIERMLARSEQPNLIAEHAARLDSIADEHPELPQLRVRANYFNAKIYDRLYNDQMKDYYFRQAMEYCDSQAYPYDMARIALLSDINFGHDFIGSYVRLKQSLELARKSDDRLLESEVMMKICHMNTILFTDTRWWEMYDYADSLFRELSLERYVVRNRINYALKHHTQGDSAKADSILSGLLHHPETTRDTLFRAKVLFDLGLVRKSSALIGQGTDIALTAGTKPSAGFVQEARWNMALFSAWDSTTPYADSIVDLISLTPDSLLLPTVRANIKLYSSRRLEHAGDHKMALEMLKEHIAEKRYVDSVYDSSALMRIEAREQIIRHDNEMRSHRVVNHLRFGLLIALTVIAALITYVIIARRLRRLHAQNEMTEHKLDETRREVVSHNLAMTEKDNLLQTIVRNVHLLESDGRITRADARALDADLRVHLSGRQDWDAFCRAFETVHPSFVEQLRENNPNLTEGDIRLAVYIRTGMTSKQIARMLQLQPTSVKMNRHRLRERIGLSSDESLEDYLSRYGRNQNE